VTPIAAHDTAAPTPTPADATASTARDERAEAPRASRWRRLSSAVAESHRAAVPF
jgi:hypothetical protein